MFGVATTQRIEFGVVSSKYEGLRNACEDACEDACEGLLKFLRRSRDEVFLRPDKRMWLRG